MASRLEERVPLLVDEEEEAGGDDLSDLQVEFKQRHAGNSAQTPKGAARPAAGYDSRAPPSTSNQPRRRRRKQYSGNEMIVAVFVVQFDIRKG